MHVGEDESKLQVEKAREYSDPCQELTCGVQHIPERVHDEGERSKEGNEREDAGVKQGFCG